jgi:hypothetical protein
MAAVLAGGPTAVISHRAAVALWQLRQAPDAPFDVTVPGRTRKGGRGLQAGLPEPSWNVLVHGFLVDFSWPRQRLVVEVDGYAFHYSRRQFNENRLRNTRLQLEGISVLRITQPRIEYAPAELLSDLRRGLRAAAA